jgi:hypothetical protein
MAHTNTATNGKVNGGLSRLAKLDYALKVNTLATIPEGKTFVAHPIVNGKINGVPANQVELAARCPGVTVRVHKGQLHLAKAVTA